MVWTLLKLLDVITKRFQFSGNVVNNSIFHWQRLCKPDAGMRRPDIPKSIDRLSWIVGYTARQPPLLLRYLKFFFVDRAFNRRAARSTINMLALIWIAAQDRK